MEADGYRVRAGEKSRGAQLVIIHQFYMDDLKCYASSTKALNHMYTAVTKVSNAIGLSVNPQKCAQAHKPARGLTIKPEEKLHDIQDTNWTYQYLGIEQKALPDPEKSLQEVRKGLKARNNFIWKSDLTAGQKVRAYNTCVAPILRYALNCGMRPGRQFESTQKRLRNWDTKMRVLLSKTKARYRLRSRITVVEIAVAFYT
uniref:Reverse transcriptase domain-containing protein n=1 Tax=Plectus sambesii TaxID=2011161 RepID=A0A914XM72_9BILA